MTCKKISKILIDPDSEKKYDEFFSGKSKQITHCIRRHVPVLASNLCMDYN